MTATRQKAHHGRPLATDAFISKLEQKLRKAAASAARRQAAETER